MSKELEKKNEYGATSIRVMEGLEAVRKRPAMYIGSTGPQGLHHLVYEVVDNSVDESLAGHCNNIQVILHSDGSCSVEDNGRGIPTDIHPTEKISAAEVVLTKLHAGGKFDKDSYRFSGGLHGVGVSVVNALSTKLYVEIYKQGTVFSQNYAKGKPLAPLAISATTHKQHGTLVRFTPDSSIFTETVAFSFDILSARLRELAFLNKGLTISITEEATTKEHSFFFEGGIVSLIEFINEKKNPIFPEVIYFSAEDKDYVLEVAMQYNEGYTEQLYSFVNNINTIDGGTHVAGFKAALTKTCNKYAQGLGILKSGNNLSSEDVREGLVGVINIKVPEPQFEGQTKGKLGNSEVKGIVETWSFANLDTYFEEHPAIIKKIIQKAELAQRAREAAKKARDLTRRKTELESTILPGKLVDCSNENPAETELFIVEGESAGGSAKTCRDRYFQAILPLKGKILNVEKARIDKILSNEEIKALIASIGTGIGEEIAIEKTRYHKIILMTDADVDGSHIRTLLLTFFFRYMKPVIEKGYLYIAQPPLYKAKIGKKEQYLKDERAFKDFLFNWAQEQLLATVDNHPLSEPGWQSFLQNITLYEHDLNFLCIKFKLTDTQAHNLLIAIKNSRLSENSSYQEIINAIQKQFPGHFVYAAKEESQKDTPDAPVNWLNIKLLNKIWQVPFSFFAYQDCYTILKKIEPLQDAELGWSLEIKEKNKIATGSGIIHLVHTITTISKPYMHIQRYKGLGEMNPDQLWESSMDKEARSLFQVSIEDALEADNWFTTLMGDDVAGRREFIEKNGRFAKNLDI